MARTDLEDTVASRVAPAGSFNLAAFGDAPATLEEARRVVHGIPIERVDPANPKLFYHDVAGPYFERLRREDPVHYVESPVYGPYWSITRFNDIMEIDMNHRQFSSDAGLGGISIFSDRKSPLPMFIAMDPPKHDVQRKAIAPMFGPDESQNHGAADPRACGEDPRRTAHRGRFRLGG
jgi:cytochrome P450